MNWKITLALLLILGISACREAFVDYPLPYEGPRLIPRVTVTDGTCRVSLARTIPPDGSWEGSVLVSGATIKLFRDDSLLFTLNETAPGQYQRSMNGNMREGSVYTLTVFADGYPEVFCGPVRAPGKANIWGLAETMRDSSISSYSIWHDNPAGLQFFVWIVQQRPIDEVYGYQTSVIAENAEYCMWNYNAYEEACLTPDIQQVKVNFSALNALLYQDSSGQILSKPVYKLRASLRVYANECLRDYRDPQDDMSSDLITNGYGRFLLYRTTADSILVNP
jgi:hypothetical protein